MLVIFEENGCLEKVDKLQNHRDHDVYAKALKILENFYELKDTVWFKKIKIKYHF